MRLPLFVALLLAAFFLAPTNRALGESADEPIVEVPFSFESGHVIVAAKIRNDVPVKFILSTGAENSSFDFSLLDKYKLMAYYTGVGIITGHNDQTVTFTRVPDIRIGEIHQSQLNMRFVSLGALSKRLGREVVGILGIDFFKGRTVQFDFPKKLVRFLPTSVGERVAKTDTGTKKIVLEMSYLTEKLTIPIVAGVTIQGKNFKALFDTGAVTVVSVSASAAKQLGLVALPDKSPPRTDKISSFAFGGLEIGPAPVLVFSKGSDFDKDMLDFDAVVGTVVLQNFVATFDFRKQVIILER